MKRSQMEPIVMYAMLMKSFLKVKIPRASPLGRPPYPHPTIPRPFLPRKCCVADYTNPTREHRVLSPAHN